MNTGRLVPNLIFRQKIADYKSTHHYNHTEAVNALIKGNANIINTANAKDKEKSQKVNW